MLDPLILLALAAVGMLAGFVDAIAGGGGMIALPALLSAGLPPVSALIMLSGIYYGAQYGGSTTAILINLPGESASVVTALDGYQMARRGRAGT